VGRNRFGERVAVDDAAPVPLLFTALIRTSYEVPVVNPVIVAVVAVETPSLNVVHVPEGDVRYSTT
jgi:hypothetical protein